MGKLKVCGMRDAANVREVASLGPDYLGFIFYPQSPRYVGTGFNLPASDFRGEAVGVFVNETLNNIMHRLKSIRSGIAQLHGSESPDECQKLRDSGFRVIKAISVGADLDTAEIRKYAGVVDYFLFDTKGKLYGGNATRFDWKLLERYDLDLPFFLSGGIGINDIRDIKEVAHPQLFAVDMNSGVETSPGVKDPEQVRRAKEIIDEL